MFSKTKNVFQKVLSHVTGKNPHSRLWEPVLEEHKQIS